LYRNKGCTMAKICSIDGCGRAHNAKGFCSLHYERFLRYGDPLFVQKNRPPNYKVVSCSVEGCCTPIFSKGLCRVHAEKLRKFGNVDAVSALTPRFLDGKPIKCCVDGCEKDVQAKGMCSAHYRRNKLYGDPKADSPVLTKNERRTHICKQRGYVYLSWKGHPAASKNGNVLEHRLVMYEKLGRVLLPGENIHHINGKRADNRPENLELWVTMQPSGQRPEDLVAFAKEILARYGN